MAWSFASRTRGHSIRGATANSTSCLGLLYHLDAPDVFVLLERIRDVCRFMTVIETRIHPHPMVRREYRGRSYWGVMGAEPSSEAAPLSREVLWSSLGNPQSFELTRSSLCNALVDVGYSSVVECHMPTWVTVAPRGTFVAFTGPKQMIRSVHGLSERVPDRLSELPAPLSEALRRHPVYGFLRRLVPGG